MPVDPLVTIVMPVYNKEAYVAKAIESVLSQTYQNLELFIIDDGSTDGSLEIIKSYQGDARVRINSQKNSGVASCRNRGISEGKGQYIIFIDGDDYFYPDYLSKSIPVLERNPACDFLHVGWDTVDEKGNHLFSTVLSQRKDYLNDLILANLFAPLGVVCRKSFINQVGLYHFYPITDDWEYWIRCAKMGGRFKSHNEILVAYRQSASNNQKVKEKQKFKYFPIIDEIFSEEYGLPEKYLKMESLCRVRHCFFIIQEYHQWGWLSEKEPFFEKACSLLKASASQEKISLSQIRFVLPCLGLAQRIKLLPYFLKGKGSFFDCISILIPKQVHWFKRILPWSEWLGKMLLKFRFEIRAFMAWAQRPPRWGKVLPVIDPRPYAFNEASRPIGISDIREKTLDFVKMMRIVSKGKCLGYRFSESCDKPTLYSLISALMIKDLYRCNLDDETKEDLELLSDYQDEDGHFRDPLIPDKIDENPELVRIGSYAFGVMAAYGKTPEIVINLKNAPYSKEEDFKKFLNQRNWHGHDGSSGIEIHKTGLMLQYARDFQHAERAGKLLDVLYETVEKRQSSDTGLYAKKLLDKNELLTEIMSASGIWRLYFYDQRAIPHSDKILEQMVKLQNILGGFGTRWNSSAFEDHSSLRILTGLMKAEDRDNPEIQRIFEKSFSALLHNLNEDGSWVFRRFVPHYLSHRQLSCGIEKGNMISTMQRTFSLAYCLTSLNQVPENWKFNWNLRKVPGY